jgi:hypothetical protein
MATPEDADPRWLELLSLAAPAGHAQNEFFASACADPVVLHVVNRSSAAGGIVQCRIVSIVTILYGREINDFAAPSPTRVAIKTLPWLICFASASVPYFRMLRTRRNFVLENLALRQQLAVFKRKHPRPKLSPPDKLFWLWAVVLGLSGKHGHR